MTDLPPSPPSIDAAPITRNMLSVTPGLLSTEQLEGIRADAKALYSAGAFVSGGLRRRNNSTTTNAKHTNKMYKKQKLVAGMTTATDESTRLCDICGIFDDAEKQPNVGNRDAREDLLDLMADLRELLQQELGIELLESMELQYLRYPGTNKNDKKKKGFYGRHFDSTTDDEITRKRTVSLLLYLNEDGWDGERDGGILRAYIQPKKKGTSSTESFTQDVVPEGGKLVLFDSKSVEHEVLPTSKERWAVVGWFLSESSGKRKAGNVEGTRKRTHNCTNDEHSRKKKKKKRRRGH